MTSAMSQGVVPAPATEANQPTASLPAAPSAAELLKQATGALSEADKSLEDVMHPRNQYALRLRAAAAGKRLQQKEQDKARAKGLKICKRCGRHAAVVCEE